MAEPERESDLPPLRKPKRVRAAKQDGPTDSELAEEAEAQRVDRRKWRAQRRKRMGYGH